MSMLESLGAAFALMLVLEGILPFVAPDAWSNTFRKIAEMPPNRIRIGGLISMALGLILLLVILG
ncbi:MAG TPA: DUF2065 domain-containing protein [Pararobbsia sp.]|nr:DUF2065 domain-containing protein [Pararobbsia sp.]